MPESELSERLRKKYASYYSKSWNQAHREHVKEYNRAYYQKHKARLDAQHRKWAAENPDKAAEIRRRTRERRKEV